MSLERNGVPGSRLEIQQREFAAAELFELIENTGIREALRRFAPSVTVVFVNAAGVVAGLPRSKEMPPPVETTRAHAAFPGTAYFFAKPGMYGSVKELEEKLKRCVEALLVPEPVGGREIHTTKDGETILVLGGPGSKSRA